MAEITKELGRIPVSRGDYQATTEYYKDNIVQYKKGSYQVVSESPIIGVPPTNDKNIVNPGWTLFAGTLDAQDVVNQVKDQEIKSIQAVADREAEILAKSDAAEVSFDNTGTSISGTNVQDALEKTDSKLSKLESEVIYDVTTNNDGAIFPSLSALLSSENLSTLIPTSVRHGGISIRFVHSSDNKYVQARCMAQNFTTDVTQWQGVDDRLLPVSRNLVENGIVAKTIGVPVEIRHDNSGGASYFANLKAGEIYKVTTSRTIGYSTRNVIGGITIQTGNFYEGDNVFTVTGDALYLSLGTFTVVEQVDVILLLENSIIDRLDNVEDKTEFSYNKVDKALTFNGDTTFRYGAVYTNGNIAEGYASHDRAITEILNVNGDVSVELLNATSTIRFAVCGKYVGNTFIELTPQLYFTNNKCVIPYNGEYDRLVLTIKPSSGTFSEEELRILRLKCTYISCSLANTNETKKIKEYRYNIGFDFDLTRIPTPTMYSSDVIRSNDLDAYNGYWEALRLQYPKYITKIDSSVTDTQFGITRPAYLTNMPIYMYKFIPKQKSGQTTLDSDTIKVMLVLGTHSQERGGMFGCLQLMQYICEGWKNDINAMMMRTSVEFYVITCLNPWGYANTGVVPYAGRINYNGVNINRNFPTPNWRSDESSKAYYNYEGDSPASEYETKTMMAFFDIVKPNIFIDVHTSGSLNTGEIGTFEFYNDKIKNELFLIADEFTARISADNRDYPDNPDNALIKIVKVPDSPAENGEHGTLAYYFGYRNNNTVSTLIECMGEQSYWSNGVYDTTQPAQGHTAKSIRECMQWQWCILQRLIDSYSQKIE